DKMHVGLDRLERRLGLLDDTDVGGDERCVNPPDHIQLEQQRLQAVDAVPFVLAELVARSHFFQAEDVIRYRTVTGVQTCALPIFGPLHVEVESNPFHDYNVLYLPYCDGSVFSGDNDVDAPDGTRHFHGRRNLAAGFDLARRLRSEERRVGKEGRSRRSGYEYSRQR